MCDNVKLEHCVPPIINNGDYKIIGNSEYITGTPIPNHSVINFFCIGQNYVLSENYSTVVCADGKLSREPPKCIFVVSCPAAFNYATDVNCTLNEEEVDCTSKTIHAGTIARMKCKPNFIDETPEILNATCSATGSWDTPLKACTSPYMCPPRPSVTINVYCELHDVEQDCSREVQDGTVARMDCKPNYIDVTDGPTIAKCINGTWTAPVKKCTPDCDYIVSEAQPLIVNGTPTKRGDTPWHVGVYRQEPEKDLTYLCGGSIISVKVVLSAAHCFYDEIKEEMNPVFEYSVAAGKLFSKWDAKENDNFVQKRKVNEVYIKTSYLGNTNRYEADIAVVVVDKLFIFSDLIHAVCVDWDLEYTQQQFEDKALGKVVGWGITTTENQAPSTILRQLIIPLVNKDECLKIVPTNFRKYVTLDKFCAGYRNGSSVCNGDSGGGFVVLPTQNNQSNYYLQGIVSVGPTFMSGTCNNYQVGVYTKVSNFISFIRKHEEINRGMEFCVIPSIPNAEVVIKSNDNGTISNKLVRNFTQIAINCNKGYTLVGDETATCLSGQWNITIVKCARDNDEPIFRKCPAPAIQNGYYENQDDPNYIHGNPILNGNWIRITCKENFTLSTKYNEFWCNNGKFHTDLPRCNSNCARIKIHAAIEIEYTLYFKGDSIPDNSVALISCPKHYTGITSKITVCRDGIWDQFYFRCVQECGDLVPERTKAEKRKFPWHVAIYRQIPEKPLKLICGGSLISDKFVFTATHCFPEDIREKNLVSEFSIAAGKYFSDWDAPEDADFVQKRNIQSFEASADGMAIVEVDTPFTLTDLVKPVCVGGISSFFDNESRNVSKAQAVGWGAALTKISTPSVASQQFTVTYFDRIQCSQMLQQNYQEYLTHEAFCVRYTNESTACNEDIGTGIFVPREIDGKKKYYIQGIKTLNKNSSCYNHEIGIYTNVHPLEYTITRLLAVRGQRIN